MSIDDVAEAIRSMEIRGAGKIARKGVEAIMELVSAYEGDDLPSLISTIDDARERILSSRPTAVSLWNGVQMSLKGIEASDSVEELKRRVMTNSTAFIERSEKALEIIGSFGSRRIRSGDTVLTHCNSQVALSVILTAFSEGKDIEVIATESRPWRQGLLTVRQLAEAGVPTTLIVDSAVRAVMRDVDIVVVGADTITSSGVVVNKIGTSQIALAAQEARVPFLVCSETYKFSPMTLSGELVEIEDRERSEVVVEGEVPSNVRVRNPVFDATPPEYVDSIVTEIGIIPPFAAYEVIVKELGQEFIFKS